MLPVAPALPPTPNAAPTLVAPMPRPSPGQCFDEDALVRAVANSAPFIDPVRRSGLSTHTNIHANCYAITL